MQKDIIVKKSKIDGKGVFAARDFKKGEVVLRWNPKIFTKEEVEKLPASKLKCIEHVGRKYYLMQAPEKFVNYSCNPNTNTKKLSDIALRNIIKGEEITSNYGKSGLDVNKCKCGKKNCKDI